MLKLLTLISLTGIFSAAKISVLQERCSNLGPTAFYHRSSCFVVSTEMLPKAQAVRSCKQFRKGHLAFILSSELIYRIESLDILRGCYWVGFEQLDNHDTLAEGWYWVMPDDTNWLMPPKPISLWNEREPGNLNMYSGCYCSHGAYLGLHDAPGAEPMFYICQYHDTEGRYQEFVENKVGAKELESEEQNTTHLLHCVNACFYSPVCMSFAYHQGIGHCVFYWKILQELTLVEKGGYRLYDVL